MKVFLFIFLFIISISSTLDAYIDLGTYGSQYIVREKNIKTQIEDSLKKHKDDIKKLAKKAFESGLIYKKVLPFSKKEAIFNEEFSLINPSTGRIFHASEIPYNVQDNICVISYQSDEILKEIIKHFGNNCRYVFLNVDIRKITKNDKFSKINVFVGNSTLLKMFNIDSTPLKISIHGNKMKYHYLNYNKILKAVKNKKY